MVSRLDWQKAQAAERRFHNETFEQGWEHYRESYRQYFNYLDIDNDLQGKTIVEIGPADFPALGYCENIGKSFIIEPMPSDHLKRFEIPIRTDLAESAKYFADEVWLFNVLQHVMNPDYIVDMAKRQANVIRFFEPINYGIDECHLWNLTLDMFRGWFGNCVIHYPPTKDVTNFHTWECAYGVWRKTI